jgi:hypothetical protein
LTSGKMALVSRRYFAQETGLMAVKVSNVSIEAGRQSI